MSLGKFCSRTIFCHIFNIWTGNRKLLPIFNYCRSLLSVLFLSLLYWILDSDNVSSVQSDEFEKKMTVLSDFTGFFVDNVRVTALDLNTV